MGSLNTASDKSPALIPAWVEVLLRSKLRRRGVKSVPDLCLQELAEQSIRQAEMKIIMDGRKQNPTTSDIIQDIEVTAQAVAIVVNNQESVEREVFVTSSTKKLLRKYGLLS